MRQYIEVLPLSDLHCGNSVCIYYDANVLYGLNITCQYYL